MQFASDNTGPAHPRVMEALIAANAGYVPSYGGDDLTAHVRDSIRAVFEAPRAEVFLVATGTAANSTALASLVRPWQGIYCSRVAHIHADECGAPELFSGGAKLVLVDEEHGKMSADALDAQIREGLPRGLHFGTPGAVSLTQVTECGTVYSLDEIGALGEVAARHGLPVHMDGARFANALEALGCTPAEMTWKAGVTALSFGATKNGCLGVEAVVLFEPDHAAPYPYIRKRTGHLFSKHRFLAAQMAAYLEGDLWRESAAAANAAGQRLAAGLRANPAAVFQHPPDANMIFVSLPRAAHARALAEGARYYLSPEDIEGGKPDDPIPVRLVCDWSTDHGEIDRFLALTSG